MQFDHLVHWVPSLDAAVRDYQALGFTVQPGGQHPQFGTHNAAWRLDARYIELIAVRDEAVARAGNGLGWPEVDATLRAGGGALAFGVLVDDVAATVAELRSRGVPVDDPQAGSIRRTDGSAGTWHYASLQEGPRWAPFFINYGHPAGQWTARFREQGFPKDPWALQGVTVQVPDPAVSASWLGNISGLDMVRTGQDAAEVRLPGCAITFARGPADRITAVVLTGPGAPRGLVAGLRYLDAGSTTVADCDRNASPPSSLSPNRACKRLRASSRYWVHLSAGSAPRRLRRIRCVRWVGGLFRKHPIRGRNGR